MSAEVRDISRAEAQRRGGWEVKPLRAFLSPVSVRNRSDAQLLSVTREAGVIVRNTESKEENHNYIPDDLSNYKFVEKGQFVINKMKAWQGSYGVSPYDGIVSPAYFVYDLDFPCKGFFSLAIRSKAYVQYFQRFSKGLRVDQWDLMPEALKLIPFAFPPLSEQKDIVAYLDAETGRIDKAIAAEEKMIALLQERREIVINEAVGGGMDFNAETQRRRGWEVVPLKRIARLKGGAGFPVQKQGRTSEAIRFIKVNALASHIDPNREYDTISQGEADAMQAKVFPKGSIVFAKVGAALLLHRFEQLPFDCCIDNNMMGLFDISANPVWLKYALSLLDFNSLVNPGAVPSVNQSQVGNLLLPLPPLPEQEEIVKRLDAETGKIDRAIEVKRRQIELLRERRQIVIDEAVTGKVKVA